MNVIMNFESNRWHFFESIRFSSDNMDTPNYELKNCDMNCCEGSKV